MRRGSYDDAAASIRPHLRSLAQRRRSAPSLVFGRALGIPWNPIREEVAVAVEQCPFVLGLSGDGSPLALDACVQLTEGQKTRERHLFLFNKELVIAKLKSSASYRLKHRLSLAELWLCPCEDDDDEDEDEEPMDLDLKTSLVLVWPLAFCVVTFCSPEVKDRWVETLHRKITEAQEVFGFSSPPPSILMKVLSVNSMTKTLTGGGTEANMDAPSEGNGKGSAQQRQLCNKEDAGKQPIGHGASLWMKLRRSSTLSGSAPRIDPNPSSLFGQPLSKICLEDGSLPTPITEIFQLLWRKAPATEGVFRKSGNSGGLKTIREQLNSGTGVDMDALPVTQLVGLLKSFLKELPGSLLVADRYDQWISAVEKEEEDEKLTEIKSVIQSIPEPNALLLRYLLCVLHHIRQNSDVNKMDARNLAVCIAPSLLHKTNGSPTQDMLVQPEEVKKVNGLTQFLIENCCSVFGEGVLTLLGDPDEEELADSTDSMSSHQHDSAYDSTDPDADGDAREGSPVDRGTAHRCQAGCAAGHRVQCSMVASSSSDGIFTPFSSTLNRRCSEPAIFPSSAVVAACSRSLEQGLARSHDDCSADAQGDFQGLKKQTSDDSFLLTRRAERRLPSSSSFGKLGGSLTADLLLLRASADRRASAACSCSSSCSLESAASNVSEGSVFTSSPLASPTALRRSHSTKHQAAAAAATASSSCRSLSVSSKASSKPDQPKAEGEVKRRTQSLRVKGLGGLFHRVSMKHGEALKEPAFPCGPLQEDSQSEAETLEGPNGPAEEEPPRRQRPLSAIEVFQHVDSRLPSCPPSYQQALLNSAQPAPPQYRRAMTVQAARELGRKRRPISMNESLLDFSSSCRVGHLSNCLPTRPELSDSTAPEPAQAFRARAMSESVSRSRQDTVARRCSQPVFEELTYAKESYV
ncbi:T cell activation RhoGTPase activating protein b isoform X1 [Alosa sapidissima]|uniref:T cell activation RhoGTPase activating protein b isoform X1 n=2 Tax=Alosa sapidissima TaxID=34773 RepID=UPI001C094F5C|nr:T cell activation RhoGTPase activating protein b isoform X1 [Alosa sapidissima]